MSEVERVWGCSICKEPVRRDWLKCPNCGNTSFEKYRVDSKELSE